MRLTVQAIRLFLKHADLLRRVPNQATIAAMNETNRVADLGRYGSFRELRERI